MEWQVGWNATVCGKRAPTSVTPSDVDQELGQLEHARRDLGDRSRQAGIGTGQAGDQRVVVRTIEAHEPDGVTTTS